MSMEGAPSTVFLELQNGRAGAAHFVSMLGANGGLGISSYFRKHHEIIRPNTELRPHLLPGPLL